MGRSSHSPDRRAGGTGDPALPRTGDPALPRTGDPALPPSMRDRIPFLLFRASAMSLALANEMLARLALNARHVGILTMVTEREPMTQKELGDALGIDRTTMEALLDDLEEKGYAAR